MSLRAAFEAAIRKDPGDAANRLVFADWLEEQGGEDDERLAARQRLLCRWYPTLSRYMEGWGPKTREYRWRLVRGRLYIERRRVDRTGWIKIEEIDVVTGELFTWVRRMRRKTAKPQKRNLTAWAPREYPPEESR